MSDFPRSPKVKLKRCVEEALEKTVLLTTGTLCFLEKELKKSEDIRKAVLQELMSEQGKLPGEPEVR